MKYRADINVLKGIAIVGVILFHLSEQLLSNNRVLLQFNSFEYEMLGGFYGVDIFLVISGFLVALYLHNKYNSNKLYLKDFIFSRISKLAPQLITVCLFTFSVGFFVFFLDSFESLIREIFKAVTFTSNFYYAKQQGYFAQDSMLQPLLHCWYLALTIQCYIVIAIIYIILSKLNKLNIIPYIYLIITIISAYLYFTTDNISRAYYLPQYRCFEFFFGAFIGTLSLNFTLERFSKQISLLAVVTVCIIMLTVTTVSKIGVVLVLLSTALLMLCRESLLKNRILEKIGTKSFSLYMWHWPLMVFVFLIYPDCSSILIIISLFILSEIVSAVLKQLPINNIKVVLPIILLIIISSRLYLHFESNKSLDSYDLANVKIVSKIELEKNKTDSFISYNRADRDADTYKYMIEGDSNAAMFEGVFADRFRNYISVINPGTLILGDNLRISLKGINSKESDNSDNYLKELNKGLSELETGGTVFLIHRWYRYYKMYQDLYGKSKGAELFLSVLSRDLKELALKYPEINFYIFGQAPEPSEFLVNCSKALEKRNRIASFIGCKTALNNISAETAQINKTLKIISEEIHNIHYINRDDVLKKSPNSNYYMLVDKDNHAIFYDKGHLTAKGAEFVFNKIVQVTK